MLVEWIFAFGIVVELLISGGKYLDLHDSLLMLFHATILLEIVVREQCTQYCVVQRRFDIGIVCFRLYNIVNASAEFEIASIECIFNTFHSFIPSFFVC